MIDGGVSVSSGEQRGTHEWGSTSGGGGQGRDSTRRILAPWEPVDYVMRLWVTDRAVRLPVSIWLADQVRLAVALGAGNSRYCVGLLEGGA
jgi:hypothetical protein